MALHRRSPPTPPKSSIPPTPPRAGFGLPKGDFFTAPKGFSRPSLCPKGEVTAPQGWVRGHFGRCGDLREEAAPKGLCRRERCPGCNAVPALSLLAAPQRRDSPLHPTAHPLLSEGDRGAEKLSSRFFFALIFSFLFLHFFLSLLDFRSPSPFPSPPPLSLFFPSPFVFLSLLSLSFCIFFSFSPFPFVFSFLSLLSFSLYIFFSFSFPFPFSPLPRYSPPPLRTASRPQRSSQCGVPPALGEGRGSPESFAAPRPQLTDSFPPPLDNIALSRIKWKKMYLQSQQYF